MKTKPFKYQLVSALPRRALINRMCGLSVFFTLLTDEANTDYQSKCQEILPAHIIPALYSFFSRTYLLVFVLDYKTKVKTKYFIA